MTCHNCQNAAKKHGKAKNGLQRFRCIPCNRTFCEDHVRPLGDMRIDLQKAILAVQLIVEGNSIRSTERITGLHRDTILDLLVLLGERCQRIMDEKIQNVPVRDVQADEIWGYVGKKEKHKRVRDIGNNLIGDAYTFVAIEANSKLVLCFELGRREFRTTLHFIDSLKRATRGRFQLSTDGFKPYIPAVESVFGAEIDYSQLIKVYASDEASRERYSPGEVIGTEVVDVTGNSDPAKVSTSYVERQNLTMRMGIRRLTRLTNGFSKKWANLKAALALHFAYYNFCRVHKTLRTTPAMEAGITNHIWTLAELLEGSSI